MAIWALRKKYQARGERISIEEAAGKVINRWNMEASDEALKKLYSKEGIEKKYDVISALIPMLPDSDDKLLDSFKKRSDKEIYLTPSRRLENKENLKKEAASYARNFGESIIEVRSLTF